MENCEYSFLITFGSCFYLSIHSAKYGLATLNKILDVFGSDQAVGYDISCVHKVTVAASSISEKAQDLHLQIAIDAFHGHVHNRLCQLSNHPLFLKGFGLEDLATCKRIFSGTNLVTPLIQHALHFHWLQFLDLQMDQWDKDKYHELSKFFLMLIFYFFTDTSNTGKFLFNNYKQAIAIISDYTSDINALKAILPGIANEDFVKWREEELQYL